jgi:hypothetical protein
MRERAFVGWIIVAAAVALPTLALSQVARQTRTLVVNGHSGDTAIVEIEGRSYVELEALVRIANGSLRFNGNQISVTCLRAAADLSVLRQRPLQIQDFPKSF